jgi:acyl-CoA dehydrogenase
VSQEIAARIRALASELDQPETPPGDHVAEDAAARRALAAVARAGLLETLLPARGAASVTAVCAVREELAAISGLADVMFVMQGLGSAAIGMAGSAGIRERWLPRVARGEAIAAIALTEPEAGSDVGHIATRAARDGGDYILDGTKVYISNAGIAGIYTLFARTGTVESGRKGLSAFALPADTPGLSVRRRLTVSAPHPIGELQLAGCRVPAAWRLGEEGEGFDIAMRVLDRFRPTVGAAACGFARRALDEACARARGRRQFGREIAQFQAIRFKLADMAVSLDAARLLVGRAARLLDAGAPAASCRRASAMAKLYATEAAQRIADEAVQIHGGLGVTRGHIVERIYREVRALRIYEGTSEIQRLVIAHSLIKDAGA